MFIDCDLPFGVGNIGCEAKRAEEFGYDALWASEIAHEPLMTLALAAAQTTTISLGTGIMVAFGRSPMNTAMMANDVQLLSRGRLVLGLGTQIKPHIEKRYSMPWSHPVPRMREYVLALRAIWASWNDGSPLRFRGEFYKHMLMTPFFDPGPNEFGNPNVFIAAVGPKMTEVVGEIGDGLLVHPLTTVRYLKEVTLPALERGFIKSGRSRDNFQISLSGLVATGPTKSSFAEAKQKVRAQIAFYASTPAYRSVLELHGWGDIQTRLNLLSRSGEWNEMTKLVSDEMLETFSVCGSPDSIAGAVTSRFHDSLDRFNIYTPYSLDVESRNFVASSLLKWKERENHGK